MLSLSTMNSVFICVTIRFSQVSCDFVHCDDERIASMNPASVWRINKKIAIKALGVEQGKEIHPHSFRHHIRYVMDTKGGITAVQRQLGHRNLAYSAVYSQKTDEELEQYLDEDHSL